jgi:hypothetical protein
MDYQNLQNELRDRLSALSRKVEAACAQGLTDLPKLSEDLACVLLREIKGYKNLRNLNAEEKRNFPGLDLADDKLRIGVQVTATASLDKVKDTLLTVGRHGLQQKYPRVQILVLTKKQASYSKEALAGSVPDGMTFDVRSDILDFRDLLSAATHASPLAVKRAIQALEAYDNGALQQLEAADFDPPDVYEVVELNLIELFPPKTLYIADLLDESSLKRTRNARKALRGMAEQLGRRLPSGFEVHETKLVTFHNLEATPNAFAGLYDVGTLTPLTLREFAHIDENHDRVAKSLLRFALQEQLIRHKVRWQHEEGLFFFVPQREGDLVREVSWKDKKSSTRTVVKYSPSKKDPSKGGFKHLAFAVDFLEIDGQWYMAIRPDWYFSTNPDYRHSPIAASLLKYIKGEEQNQDVEQHFRFLCAWLRMLEADDLLSFQNESKVSLSFGEAVTFENHPYLEDRYWLPSPRKAPAAAVDAIATMGGLFNV